MEIKDNKTTAPLEHYKSLYRKLDPNTAAARCGLVYESGEFRVVYLGKQVNITFPEFSVTYAVSGEKLSDEAGILLIRYIIEGAGGHGSGKFVSYSEIPWGDVYLSNFKGRCIMRLAFGFGFDLERFAKACRALGGVPAEGGDSAFDIEFIDGFIIRVIIWTADDEFPPNAQILFSDNFPMGFTAEDIAVVGDVLISAMKRA